MSAMSDYLELKFLDHFTGRAATSAPSAVFVGLSTGSFGSVSHFGIFDASSGGNLLFHGAFASAKTIASGDVLKIASGSLTITAA